ncbi:uncharacterized protein LOC129806705 [Phlebotomus papatasi]|uniref:uncharacterized protein LOC129806705 n=2 Tax=Phlebotomus papatasi TaxID=29031 RepID=UPI0024836A26|nr:uncharacterized protein LOC129806705 [Phlebotomus papatasi]
MPRKSQRATKGRPPTRYGFDEEDNDLELTLTQAKIERTRKEMEFLSLREKELELRQSMMKSKRMNSPTILGDVQGDIPRTSTPFSSNSRKKVELFNPLVTRGNVVSDDEEAPVNLDVIVDRFAEFQKKLIDDAAPKKEVLTMTNDQFHSAIQEAVKAKEREIDTKLTGSKVKQNATNDVDKHSKTSSDVLEVMERFLVRQSFGTDVQKFDGSVKEWPLFRAWYENTTQTCGYTDVERLNLLQRCLTGEAKETVRFLLYSASNVNKALSSLEERYGQPEHLIRTMIAQVKAYPPVRVDKPESLVEFSTMMVNMVAAIEEFNRMCYIDNPQLLDELVLKLPMSMQISWSEFQVTKSYVTVKTLCDWIAVKARAANYRVQVRDSAKIEQKPVKGKTVATVNELTELRAEMAACSFCKGKHAPQNCETFKKLKISDRWKIVREKGVCFRCLKPNHSLSTCSDNGKCPKPGCGQKHHNLLHRDDKQQMFSLAQREDEEKLDASDFPTETDQDSDQEDEISPQRGIVMTGATVAHANTSNKILMKILPVYVTGPKGTLKVYAFLDEGSMLTMMKASLAEKLGLSGPKCPLTWQGAGPTACTDLTSTVVNCRIRGTHPKAKEYLMQKVRTVCELSLPRQTVDMEALSRDWKHMADGHSESMVDAEPDLLIGLDNTPLIVSREIIHGPWNAPYLALTWLGWVVMGKLNNQTSCEVKTYSYSIVERKDELYEMVKNSFSLEGFGTEGQEKVLSREDKRALEIMKRTTRRTSDGRFETGLLWKQGHQPIVPESRDVAVKRLYTMERKLDRDPALAEAYCAKISDHLEKGYLIKLTEEDRMTPTGNTWYLPHFAVFHPAKGKIRVVFDCAAKSGNVSLNDLLMSGPDLLKSLPAVLENFRKGKFAFTGDIKEMFHRVYVRAEDTNYQRILWRGMDRKNEPEEYKMNVMTFGASCSPTLASYVKNLNAQEYAEEFPEAVKGILHNTYCDDYLGCADTIEESRGLIKDIVQVHKAGGFDIVNWTANDSRILNCVSDTMKSLNAKDEPERILGLWWDSSEDVFTFKTTFHRVASDILSEEKIPTMREVLRLVMSIFDPLGFLAMFSVKGKMILQEIWRQKIGWDDIIYGVALEQWQAFIKELKMIDTVKIPRCYSPKLPEATSIQLHVFGDASESAYASVAYLRIESENSVEVAFVCARTKVAPLKATSIPRLELQAAVLSARVSVAVKTSLDLEFDRVVLWTDSLTVMGWIKSDSRRYKQFVGHRISEIDQLTEIHQWRWISTTQNPADLATRRKPCDFSASSKWFTGAPFLKLEEEQWPQDDKKQKVADNGDIEVFQVLVNVERFIGNRLIPEMSRFSRWNRLVRATAQVKNCAQFWLKKWRKAKENLKTSELPGLKVSDLIEAEKVLLQEIQSVYRREIQCLQEGKVIPKESDLYHLTPFVDSDGLLKMRSRLQNSEVRVKCPIILPPKHVGTKLIISDFHVRNHHQGREQVVNNVRERFYIPRVRVAVKRAWHECQICKNKRAQPLIPEMAVLPSARVNDSVYPFVKSGMDYFGPLEVKVGRRVEKRWGVIFTCLATRAVHLEVAHSLTTDSAIMAIRRFMNRRGSITDMFCDNGTNLRGADNEFRRLYAAVDEKKIQETFSEKRVEFHFNPPAAPHMGGVWERLVRSVKVVLKEVMRTRHPTDEELHTFFIEVEYILNNRPLTYVSIDPDDETAITPNHFLIGRSGENRPIGTFDDSDLFLRKAWRRAQYYADHFWRRWMREYLPELTRRTKWYSTTKTIKIGDVVVVCDEQLPRNQWPLGRVEEVFPAPDGKIRSAMVRTRYGLYKRPVAKLAVLDVE